MNYEDLDKMLKAHPERTLGAGADESEIARAERVLGVKLRGAYRRFLQDHGWGGAAQLELFGLGNDVPKHLDLVRITESERTEMNPRLREALIPIWNDGGGNLYCLDLAANPNEPPVIFWDHEQQDDQLLDVVASDFVSWFIEQLT
jgi:cell wall assembly regulator SMI1